MRQKDETKAQVILRATLEEVRAVGLAGLSVDAVARRAGVATGTVYVYFKGKEALLDQLYLHTKQKLAVAFRPADEAAPLRLAFAQMTGAYLDYVRDHEADLVFMAQMANSPYVTPETRQAAVVGLRPVMSLLERGKTEHLLKDMPTVWMATFLYETVKAMAPLSRNLPPDRYRDLRDTVAGLCWDALKA